jgi:hypothetical protein
MKGIISISILTVLFKPEGELADFKHVSLEVCSAEMPANTRRTVLSQPRAKQ